MDFMFSKCLQILKILLKKRKQMWYSNSMVKFNIYKYIKKGSQKWGIYAGFRGGCRPNNYSTVQQLRTQSVDDGG